MPAPGVGDFLVFDVCTGLGPVAWCCLMRSARETKDENTMKMNHIRVASKLWATLLGMLALMLAASLLTQSRMNSAMHQALQDVSVYEAQIRRAVQWSGVMGDYIERTLASVATNEEHIEKLFTERVKLSVTEAVQVKQQIQQVLSTPQDKLALDKVDAARADMDKVLEQLADVRASDAYTARRDFAFNDFLPKANAYREALAAFVTLQEAQRDASIAEADADSRNTCLLYTSDAADDTPCVDLGGRRRHGAGRVAGAFHCPAFAPVGGSGPPVERR